LPNSRDLGRQYDLTDADVTAILDIAKSENPEHYLFLRLIGEARGLRIGEVLGVKKRSFYERWIDKNRRELGKERVESITDLPGIYTKDIRDGSLWIRRKGGQEKQVRLTDDLYKELSEFAKSRKKGKLFGFRESQGYVFTLRYARMAGIKDWFLVHPHRLRHYFITHVHFAQGEKRDLKITQNLAGHKSDRTTLRYIRNLTPEEEKTELERLVHRS